MSRKFSVVTTFNQAGYDKYGSRMIDTFLLNWPKEVHLYVYAEDCTVTQAAPNLTVYDFHKQVPQLIAFKEQYRDDLRANGKLAIGPVDKKGKYQGIGFKWDAVRFCHKIYAVCDLSIRSTDTVIWMDADMVCHTAMPLEFLEKMIPASAGVAYLGRNKKYTECGLYALNCSLPDTKEFIKRFQAAYDSAETGIFKMTEWHDSWVFDRIRETMPATWAQLNWNKGIVQGEGHPLINSEWGAYLDHLKGKRKDTGHSLPQDLVVTRPESYWSTVS